MNKRHGLILLLLAFALSGCVPSAPRTTPTPLPLSEGEVQATAAFLSQQTLEAMPSATPLPTETPVVVTPTKTATPKPPTQTATETPNPILLTLTATLAGTDQAAGTQAGTGTPASAVNTTPSATIDPQPLAYGTLPPQVPYGNVTIVNRAKADAYISLRCVRADGQVSILEYPVKNSAGGKAPAGKYTYVAWVGGRQFTGSFSLSNGDDMTITLFKDRITVVNK